jgi:hypothetical protein
VSVLIDVGPGDNSQVDVFGSSPIEVLNAQT